MRARLALLPLLLTLPTCVGPPRPAPAPAALPAPAPTPAPLAADWRDWPLAPGAWRYAATASGTAATFGSAVALRCDRARGQVALAAAGSGPLTVRTTSVTRAIVGDAPLAASDPLLDAIAFSRGRFAVERAGQPPLALPVQAEIGRVIEDCRG